MTLCSLFLSLRRLLSHNPCTCLPSLLFRTWLRAMGVRALCCRVVCGLRAVCAAACVRAAGCAAVHCGWNVGEIRATRCRVCVICCVCVCVCVCLLSRAMGGGWACFLHARPARGAAIRAFCACLCVHACVCVCIGVPDSLSSSFIFTLLSRFRSPSVRRRNTGLESCSSPK
jgi:hypothetical protein